ncbi:MAG: Bax inhibitor-1/YccA family protein [Acidimicrobiales bacterium]
MRTSNPALNDQIFARETPAELRSGWASPAGPATIEQGTTRAAWAPGRVRSGPDSVSPWPPSSAPPGYESMRLGGVVSASAVLLALLLTAAYFGWQSVKIVTATNLAGEEVVVSRSIPPWLFVSVIVGLVLAIVTIFKPKLARITAPLYALAEGFFLGAISHLYEVQYDGIVLQAVGLTVGVFLIMLFLYATRIIKVTRNLMLGIVCATGAVGLVYLVSFLARIFGADIPFIHDAGPIGIGFSLVVVVIAALNLVLDFDFIERGVAMHAPRHMEWYGAFGLLVTLIWLYLELLRLLSKLRSR